jgi:hypothetical protein
LKLSILSNTFEFIYSTCFLEPVKRQARLAATTCAHECQETRFGEQSLHFDNRSLPPNEAGQLNRKLVRHKLYLLREKSKTITLAPWSN